MKNNITEFFGMPEGTWVWCLHCERCFQVGEFREIEGFQLCPYPDCNGDIAFDHQTWEDIRMLHPDYPSEPERDKVYPLYG